MISFCEEREIAMKKFFGLLLALVLALSLAACGGGTDGGLTVEEGKLHMSTNAQFPPYEMITDSGGFEGIDVEIAGLIAEKLGLELVVDDMGFTASLEAVQDGKSDIAMGAITVTEERKANMDFSDVYSTGIQVVIVPDGSPIATVDDLAGAELIGTQEGTTGYEYCSAAPEDGGYGEEHVMAYESGAVAIQALLTGKVDCVVIDNQPAQEYVKANPTLKILDTEFAIEDYAIALRKGNTALMEKVNAALAELIADGSIQAVVDQYISAD